MIQPIGGPSKNKNPAESSPGSSRWPNSKPKRAENYSPAQEAPASKNPAEARIQPKRPRVARIQPRKRESNPGGRVGGPSQEVRSQPSIPQDARIQPGRPRRLEPSPNGHQQAKIQPANPAQEAPGEPKSSLAQNPFQQAQEPQGDQKARVQLSRPQPARIQLRNPTHPS